MSARGSAEHIRSDCSKMTIATQLRENYSLLNWILIQKLPCPSLVAEIKLPNNVSVVKSLHLHQFELAKEIEHEVSDTDEENKMHSIVQEDVADEDDVELDNKYEGDEINGDDIRSLSSILNEMMSKPYTMEYKILANPHLSYLLITISLQVML